MRETLSAETSSMIRKLLLMSIKVFLLKWCWLGSVCCSQADWCRVNENYRNVSTLCSLVSQIKKSEIFGESSERARRRIVGVATLHGQYTDKFSQSKHPPGAICWRSHYLLNNIVWPFCRYQSDAITFFRPLNILSTTWQALNCWKLKISFLLDIYISNKNANDVINLVIDEGEKFSANETNNQSLRVKINDTRLMTF